MSCYIRVVRESGGLGDLVRVLAVVQGLRKKYPQARLHFYGADYLRDLIAPRSDAFDLYIPCAYALRNREEPLDEHRYPHLARSITYSISVDCWCWAYLHEPATQGICSSDRIELWCQRAGVEPERPALTLLESDLVWRDKCREKLGNSKVIGIQPGATCRSREWPYQYWDVLIELCQAAGIKVVLFDVCYRWQGQIQPRENLEFSISRPWPETLGRLAALDLMVTPDSGFFHLAGAIKKRSLGLFGCTSGQIISRPWNFGQHTHDYLQLRHSEIDYDMLPKANTSGVPCMPICYMQWCRGWDGDRYRKHNEHCSLLVQLGPDRVFAKIQEILGESNG